MSHGPLPAAIYWRRRLIFVAVVLAVVWVILRLVGGDDGSTAEPAVTATPGPPPAVVPVNGAFEVALSPGATACDPQLVRVTPSVPTGQSAGGAVQIDLVVSTSEPAPCTLQPADADLIAVISTDGGAVWDSTQCSSSLLAKPTQLAGGGWATVVVTTWSGRRSGSSCAGSEAFAGAGKYTVQAGTLGGEPGAAGFALS